MMSCEDGMKRCICPGLLDAIHNGLKSLEEEGAPEMVKEDFVYDMLHGGWENCHCDASKGDTNEMTPEEKLAVSIIKDEPEFDKFQIIRELRVTTGLELYEVTRTLDKLIKNRIIKEVEGYKYELVA